MSSLPLSMEEGMFQKCLCGVVNLRVGQRDSDNCAQGYTGLAYDQATRGGRGHGE